MKMPRNVGDTLGRILKRCLVNEGGKRKGSPSFSWGFWLCRDSIIWERLEGYIFKQLNIANKDLASYTVYLNINHI